MKIPLPHCPSLRLLLFLFFLTFIFLRANAQNEAIDDLFSQLENAKEDTVKIDILQDICWEFGTLNIDSALYYGKKAVLLSKNLTESDFEAVTRRYIARAYNYFGEYENAIIQLEKGLTADPGIKDPSIKGNLYADLGNNYDASGNFELASEHFYNALRVFKKTGNHERLGAIKINLCYFYCNFGDFEEMIRLAKEAEDHLIEVDDQVLIAVTYTLRGVAYGKLEMYDRALKDHNYAMSTYKEYDAQDRISEALSNIGTIYQAQEKYDLALDYFYQALVIDKALGSPAYIAITYSNIAQIYNEKGNLKKSTEYFNKSIEIAKKGGRLEMLMTTLGQAAQTYYEERNFERAYEYLTFHQQIKDSLLSEEKSKQILELREQYNSEIKEQEIINIKNATEAKNVKTNLMFTILVASLGVLGMTLIIIVLHTKQRKNKVIQARNEAEQKALRSQMNPHFIFNSLNSIQYFISKNKSYEANIYLSKFAQLIRRNFEHSRMGFVSVEQELDLIKGYVELEELRFSEQFDAQWDIHSDLDLDVKIPSMILQPFIENAILHGLTPLESRKGILKIELLELNDYVEVVISDNGNGFIKETKAQNELKLKKSRGMEIVKERLTLYSLKLKQEMSYDLTTSELGTTVIVKFPILSEKELIF